MRGEQFFRQAQAALKARQLGFRSISHTSQLRLYGEYRSTEDHGYYWKQGRIAAAHQAEGEASVVRVRAIDTEPQAVRHTQDLVVTQKHIETRRVIIKPLTLFQKRRFLERRRMTRVASLWLDDIYRIQVKGTKQWKTGVVLSISGYWDQTVVIRDVDEPVQARFHFTQHDLETGRVVLRPGTRRERLKRRPIAPPRRHEKAPALPTDGGEKDRPFGICCVNELTTPPLRWSGLTPPLKAAHPP
jgi:hypothetical protein